MLASHCTGHESIRHIIIPDYFITETIAGLLVTPFVVHKGLPVFFGKIILYIYCNRFLNISEPSLSVSGLWITKIFSNTSTWVKSDDKNSFSVLGHPKIHGIYDFRIGNIISNLPKASKNNLYSLTLIIGKKSFYILQKESRGLIAFQYSSDIIEQCAFSFIFEPEP